ncbi:MAG TPA: hypothetical protein VK436_03545 [Methanocella sp.]|nr:hypothetical protein [Methanocella sp.]
MSKQYVIVLLLFVALAATVTMAGCTTGPANNSTLKPTPASTTTIKIGNDTAMFDKTRFHTFEYRIMAVAGNSTSQVGDIKAEYDTASYGGFSNASHMKETIVEGQGADAATTVNDLYYNPTTNFLLGGHASRTNSSGSQEKDIKSSDTDYWNADMSSISSNVKFTSQGSEQVTVPKGTFAATKYTSVDSAISLWMTPSVPLPVQISGAGNTNGVSYTTIMQLVNYA